MKLSQAGTQDEFVFTPLTAPDGSKSARGVRALPAESAVDKGGRGRELPGTPGFTPPTSLPPKS